jgi:hypothetical protein
MSDQDTNQDTTPTISYQGQTYNRVCGHPMTGILLTFHCCLAPNHEGEHMMAGFYARYLKDDLTGAIYMREGR